VLPGFLEFESLRRSALGLGTVLSPSIGDGGTRSL
jgi:hypothetical protein